MYSGWRGASRVQREEDYLLSSRNTGLFALTATLVMTEFNTTTLVAFSSVGYFAGWWGLSLPFVFLVGLAFYSVTVARQWKRLDAYSTAQLFKAKYGNVIGKLAAASLLLAMIGFSATYVKSMYLVFGPILEGWNEWSVTALSVAIVLLITLRGGLKSVIGADVVSFVAVLILLPTIMVYSFLQAGPDAITKIAEAIPLDRAMKALPPEYVASLIALTCFTYIAAPWYGQKIFAARNESTAFLAVAISAVLVFALYGMAVLSVAALQIMDVDLAAAQEGLPYLVTILPAGLRGLTYGLFFAAAATTLAGVWSAMSSMAVGDFLAKGSDSPRRGILLTAGFAATSYLLANVLVDNVLQKLILANIPVAALSFALLAGFHWKKVSRAGASVSILAGLGWGVFCYLYFGEGGMYTVYWAAGIPGFFILGILGSLTWPDRATSPHGK